MKRPFNEKGGIFLIQTIWYHYSKWIKECKLDTYKPCQLQSDNRAYKKHDLISIQHCYFFHANMQGGCSHLTALPLSIRQIWHSASCWSKNYQTAGAITVSKRSCLFWVQVRQKAWWKITGGEKHLSWLLTGGLPLAAACNFHHWLAFLPLFSTRTTL